MLNDEITRKNLIVDLSLDFALEVIKLSAYSYQLLAISGQLKEYN